MLYGKSAIDAVVNKGDNLHFDEGFAIFNGARNIFIGSNVFLVDTLINAGDNEGEVHIEDFVFFGHGVKILARSHDYREIDKARQLAITEAKIVIKKGAWVASGVIILKGVTVGENSVVAAGSVVTRDVPRNSIAAGNPARVIKRIE